MSNSADKTHFATTIDASAESTLLKPNARLDAAIANSAKNNLPTITVNPLQGAYLAIQCKLIGAKEVLEIGVLGGYSTIWFAETGAHVTGIEIDPKRRDVALENTKGLKVDIILGAALEVLPKLVEQKRVFDFVFIDALWNEQFEYFQWALKLTRSGGCIYVDNVVREVIEFEEGLSKGQSDSGETLLTKVGRAEQVDATLIGTICSHKAADEKYDGFLLAFVKEGI